MLFRSVSALRYEALLAHGRIPADTGVAIGSLDAQAVLQALPPGWARPVPGRAAQSRATSVLHPG